MSTVYQRLLRERIAQLPPALCNFLGADRGQRAAGRFAVTWAAGRLRRLAAAAMRLPPPGVYDLELDVLPDAGGQRWVRRFGPHTVETTQTDRRGLLIESSGLASLGFALIVEDESLLFRTRRAWVCGVPLPLWLAPNIEAVNWPSESGGWRVRVRFGFPLLGFIGEYEGEVIPESAPPGRPRKPPEEGLLTDVTGAARAPKHADSVSRARRALDLEASGKE